MSPRILLLWFLLKHCQENKGARSWGETGGESKKCHWQGSRAYVTVNSAALVFIKALPKKGCQIEIHYASGKRPNKGKENMLKALRNQRAQ